MVTVIEGDGHPSGNQCPEVPRRALNTGSASGMWTG